MTGRLLWARYALAGLLCGMAAPAAAQQSVVPDLPAPAAPVTPWLLHTDFVRTQLEHPRVRRARIAARFGIKQLFRERGIEYPAAEIFLRVFKRERMLELWVRPASADRFSLLKAYPICALTGEIGPKRREGDNQTPEGFYEIDSFNPSSEYLLSLHVNYPNAADRVLGDRQAPGGSIYIHGGCRTAGCIAVTDEAIQQLYWIAVEARAAGQTRIPVHIFPARMTAEELARLENAFRGQSELLAFWENLRPGYEYFERFGTPPQVRVNVDGRYEIAVPAPAESPRSMAGSSR